MSRRLIALPLLLALAACERGCGGDASDTAPPRPVTSVAGLPSLPPDPREAVLAKSVASILERQHLSQRKLDDAVSRQAFDAFLDRLDGGKLYLLEEHVTALHSMADQLDDQLRQGDLMLARQAAALLSERREVAAKLVAELLREPLDFSDDEAIETDPEKIGYAKSEGELRDRWRRTLELQVLQRVSTMEDIETARKQREGNGAGNGAGEGAGEGAGDAGAGGDAAIDRGETIPATFEGKEEKARQDVATSYEARFKRFRDRDALEPAERFLNAVASVYDPHTNYLPPAEKENFDIQMTGTLEGIGALLGVKDHLVEVRELVPGGASWRQGKLEAGDLILAVTPENGKPIDITDMSLDRVVSLIRGPKGTVVTLRVQKPDRRIEEIAITRDVVIVEASYARGAVIKAGADAPSLCYIVLPGFYGNTRRGAVAERNASADVRKLLENCEARRIAGAVLDLRGNGGGLLAHAVDIVGHFIETGPVVQVRGSDGETSVYGDEDPSVAYTGDVVVLVDRFSASASEIVAGALQDYHRAVVVGTGPTHGKGTVQNLIELDRLPVASGAPLGIVKVTTDQYYLVDGDSTQSRGVVPDVVLPDPAASVESGERYLEHAIPWSEIKALQHPSRPVHWDVAALAEASRARVAGEPFFEAIDKRNRLLEQRRKDTSLPLSRERSRERRARDEEEVDALRRALDDGQDRFEVASIDYAPDDNSQDPRIEEQLARWRTELGRDAWVAEAAHVLADMLKGR